MRPSISSLFICVTPFASLTACADTVYTSPSAFAAATKGDTTITFDGIAPAGGFVNETNPFTMNGVTFSTDSTSFMNINDAAYYSPAYMGGGYLLTSTTNGSPTEVLTITLPSVTAVAFDFGGLFGPADNVSVTLSDGFATMISSPDSVQGTQTLAFFGFTSTTPLTSIQFVLPNAPNYNAIDNFEFGSNAVPEPSSWCFLLTGLMAAIQSLRSSFRRE